MDINPKMPPPRERVHRNGTPATVPPADPKKDPEWSRPTERQNPADPPKRAATHGPIKVLYPPCIALLAVKLPIQPECVARFVLISQ